MTAINPARFRAGLEALSSRQRFVFPGSAIPDDFRASAVLIAFWEELGEVHTTLIQRPNIMSRHAGEVSLPGGLLEEGESWVDAALREAHEEVGVVPNSAEVLGLLDDAWTGAGNHIVPVVAWLPNTPDLVPNPAEVDEIHILSAAELLRPEARSEETVTVRGHPYVDHKLSWRDGHAIGPTADMLLEALDWARGLSPARGEHRLRELRTYTRPAAQ